MIKLTSILKEIVVRPPSLMYGITVDGKRIEFKLDEDETLDINNYEENFKSLHIHDRRIKYLYCYNNDLTSLNVQGCTNLEDLNCDENVEIIR